MHADMSFIGLFMQASLLVKLVMLTLFGLSILSWAVIIQRRNLLTQTRANILKFEDKFWSGVDLNRLYAELQARGEPSSGMEAMFVAGFKEFSRLGQLSGRTPAAVMDGSYRAMRVSLNREIEALEANLPLLATIWFNQSLYRSVWYRVGDHELLYRPWRGGKRYPGHGGSRGSPKR